MKKEFQKIIQEYAKGDIDDIVGLYEIIGLLGHSQNVTDAKKLESLTLEFIKDLLSANFKAGGFKENDINFRLWNDQSYDYVSARIQKEWKALGRVPNIGDIVWFGLPGYNYDQESV